LYAAKVISRSKRFKEAVTPTNQRNRAEETAAHLASEEQLGDFLLELTSLMRDRKWDSEAALRQAARRRVQEVRALEGLTK